MDPLKTCDMCGTTSNETAIFNTTYAKGEMSICLQCLTEGILEVSKDFKTQKLSVPSPKEIRFEDFDLEEFDVKVPEQVFGFNCEKCGDIMFSDTFPVSCICGHMNNESIIHKQDLLNRK